MPSFPSRAISRSKLNSTSSSILSSPSTVRIYDGKNKVSFTAGKDDDQKGTFTGGKATIPASAVIYFQVTGGIPPFTYSVSFTPEGGSEQQLWSDTQRQAKFPSPPTSNQHGKLAIQVTDSAATPHIYKNTLDLTVTIASPPRADTPLETGAPEAHWIPDPPLPPPPGTSAYEIKPDSDFPLNVGTSVVLDIIGGPALPSVIVGGTTYQLQDDRKVQFDVKPGETTQVEVDYPGAAPGNEFHLLFDFNKPADDAQISNYVGADARPDDSAFLGTTVPPDVSGGENLRGADALKFWVENALDLSQPITFAGLASNEGQDGNNQTNDLLSTRRANIAKAIVSTIAGANVGGVIGLGTSTSGTSRGVDRVARIVGTAKTIAPYKLTGKVARDATGQTTPPPPPASPAPPNPPANKKPGFLRRLSVRARFEHSDPDPVLFEISGEVDFETSSEAALRNATGSTDSLGLHPTAAASSKLNPADGLTDFTLTVTHDQATNDYVEDLKLGAAPADIDGLLRMTNAQPFSRLKDTLGAVLIFTPILNAATEAIDPASAGDWTSIAVDLGVPAAIGALGFLHTTEATLFGGELVLRENIPGGISSTQFTNASLTFDYGVSFRIDVNALDIHSSGNMKVRYKAVGSEPAFRRSAQSAVRPRYQQGLLARPQRSVAVQSAGSPRKSAEGCRRAHRSLQSAHGRA